MYGLWFVLANLGRFSRSSTPGKLDSKFRVQGGADSRLEIFSRGGRISGKKTEPRVGEKRDMVEYQRTLAVGHVADDFVSETGSSQRLRASDDRKV